MVNVELVYVAADQSIVHINLELASGSTVANALALATIYDSHPETRSCAVGIFSKIVSLDTILRDGDRVELYRPLALDPKEKRRQLARKKK